MHAMTPFTDDPATDPPHITDVGAVKALNAAAAHLDAAALVLEHVHGKGTPEAEAVLALFDSTHKLLRSGF